MQTYSFFLNIQIIQVCSSIFQTVYLPINGTARNGNAFFKEGREKLDPAVLGQFWQVDDTYLQTLGIKLVEGRNFSYNMADDTAGRSVIINQNMMKKLGLKNPIGARIYDNGIYTVIGVVQDFNFKSMRGEISPIVLHFGLSTSIMTVTLRGSDVQLAVTNASALWKAYSPNQPIRYTFLDEEFANMYADITRTDKIFTSFAVLAIYYRLPGFICPLGFYGRAAKQRDRYPQDIRCQRSGYYHVVVAGFFKTGYGGYFDSVAYCLVGYAQMAAGFCL